MEMIVGQAFEQLDTDEMMNITGGAAPATVTTASTFWCFAASAAITLISYVTVKVF